MNWKFWEKKSSEGVIQKNEKLPKPKEIQSLVGQHLVVKLGQNPDWVWRLRSVSLPRGNSKNLFDVRVFDEHKTGGKKIVVKDYLTLDTHPDMILFEGWYDKDSGAVEVTKKVG
jgi:hypothetical protein